MRLISTCYSILALTFSMVSARPLLAGDVAPIALTIQPAHFDCIVDISSWPYGILQFDVDAEKVAGLGSGRLSFYAFDAGQCSFDDNFWKTLASQAIAGQLYTWIEAKTQKLCHALSWKHQGTPFVFIDERARPDFNAELSSSNACTLSSPLSLIQ